MAVIKKYTKKDGTTAYMFNAYLGVDPLTGKSKRTTRRGFRTQKEAKLALSRLQLEVDSKGFVKQNYSTFNDVYELWYAQYINTVKPITADKTERTFRLHILPKFGNHKINNISKLACQKAVNEWSVELQSFKLVKSIANKLFDYAVSQDIIESNPMQYVVIPKTEKIPNEKKFFLELSELKEFLNRAKSELSFHDYLMFRVLSFSGMRKGELQALTWEDVNFIDNSISINKTLSLVKKKYSISTTKTDSSNRIIGIDELTMSEMLKWKKLQKEELFKRGIRVKKDDKQLVFHRDDNTFVYPYYLNYILNRILKVNINPHAFRHTHASLLFESGATIKDVQSRLGHTNINTTMNIYTHVTKTTEKKAIDKLSRYANF